MEERADSTGKEEREHYESDAGNEERCIVEKDTRLPRIKTKAAIDGQARTMTRTGCVCDYSTFLSRYETRKQTARFLFT